MVTEDQEDFTLRHFLPIEMLATGEKARVVEIDGRQEAIHRLHEMGLQEGAQIRMLRPGKPCIIAIENRRLSFRGERTANVLVETCQST